MIKVRAKRIFTRTRVPGADYVINHYVGCSFACSYCYARFICRFKNYGEWGSWIEAKINAPELVKGKKVEGKVLMSTLSDPYQPVEAELELTRRILENMDKSTDLEILTKSPLVLRDIDLLREFKMVKAGLTLSFDGKAKKLFEPKTPGNKARIRALKRLREEGITTYGFISPVIPGITDVFDLIERSKDYVDYYWIEILNLRGAGEEFVEILREKYPESYGFMKNRKEMRKFVEKLGERLRKKKVRVKAIVVHPWKLVSFAYDNEKKNK